MTKKRSLFLRIFDYKMFLYDFARILALWSMVLYLRPKRIYSGGKRPKKAYRGSYIISANHTGFMDPVIVMGGFWMRRVCFLATKDLYKNKFATVLLNGAGCIQIDKDNPSVDSFKKIANCLNRGHIACVFPGGTIAHEEGDDIGVFKSGIVMMAIMAETEILPVYLPERKSLLRRQKIIYGDRVNYKDYVKGLFPSMDDIEKITQVLLEKEIELKNKYLELENKRRK